MVIPLLLLFAVGSLALYESCDYYQELKPNQPYYIYSPGYPKSYLPGVYKPTLIREALWRGTVEILPT